MILPNAAAIAAQNALKALESAAVPTTTNAQENSNVTDTTTTTTNATVAAAAPKAKDEMPRYVAVGMTPDLWNAIQEQMPANKPTGTFLAEIIAEKLGVTLTVKSRSKYASEEEKKAAQEKARKDRAALIKELLAAHKAKQNA